MKLFAWEPITKLIRSAKMLFFGSFHSLFSGSAGFVISFCIFCFMLFFGQAAASDLSLKRQQFSLGGTWTHVTRTKSGGTKQDGNLGGVLFNYDRLKRYGWYVGAEAAYNSGTLSGYRGTSQLQNREKIRSRYNDYYAEGRFGYTFQQKECWQIALTPFVGGGYLEERNRFIHPSTNHFHFKTRYGYALAGFLLWAHPVEDWELGVIFRAKLTIDPECKVTNDPNLDSMTQRISERVHYYVALPVTYRLTPCGHYALTLKPFYETRLYGFHPGYPSDFIKTRYENWGIALQLQFRI